jgi:predicted Rossmann fold flavoprotein
MVVAIIGGGAAGFFAATNCAENHPEHTVVIFEKSNKVLAKVRVSGGGRCNVTHACFDISKLIDFYPRGKKELRNAFSRFSTMDTVRWFESRGVKLKAEADGRMFPVTNNSETIIRCLLSEAERNRVAVKMNYAIQNIRQEETHFMLKFINGEDLRCDRIIIATGGSPARSGYDWIAATGHTIVPPVPSLFTFNIPESTLKGLEGISVTPATVRIEGENFESTGPVLITHWGLSGPAVLRLSAFAARWFQENNYSARCHINWLSEMTQQEVHDEIFRIKAEHPGRKMSGIAFHNLSARLWERLCNLSGIDSEDRCDEIGKTKLNRLVQHCSNQVVTISGKTTFKEEFVTCGGVSLKDVNMQTMESRKMKGIFFAGEVLDIDGLTGGFNFQSAWTTAYLAAMNVFQHSGNKADRN